MLVYWILFFLPAFWRYMSGFYPQFLKSGFAAISLIFILVIGLRDRVGCDWNNYLKSFLDIGQNPLNVSLEAYEPGHVLINMLASDLDLSVHATNFVYAIIFVLGLMAFLRRQPMPWLALMLAVSYLIVVVAMGYSRQSTAIGILFFAFNACADRRVFATVGWVIVAALFHKSALLFICLLVPAREFRRDIINLATIPLAATGLYFMSSDVERYNVGYVQSGMISEGGPTRLLLSALAGAGFFVFWKSFRVYRDKYLFFLLASLSILSLPATLVASTAADRLALYLLPFQVAVMSRLPLAFADVRVRNSLVVGVITLYAAQLYIWLNYAVNSFCWVPYNNLILPSAS